MRICILTHYSYCTKKIAVMKVLNLCLVFGLQLLFYTGSDGTGLSTGTCTFARSTTSSYTTYYTSFYTVQEVSTYGCGFLWLSRCNRYSTRYVYQILSTAAYYITYYTHTDCCTGYSRIDGVCTPQCTQGCVHGTCTSPDTCTCNSGWTGTNCSTDINECSLNSTNVCEQICTNNIGSYTCSCYDGCSINATNISACTDVDECTTGDNNCDQNCHNLHCKLGRYNCSCNDGYTLGVDGHTCIDIDECLSNTHDCEQICTNTIGSYTCSCVLDCTLNSDNSSCDDVNECMTDNGGCSQVCTNLHCKLGRYSCSCVDGYHLGVDDHTCIDTNECSDGTHECHHICYNNIGSYTCDCVSGCYLNDIDNRTCIDIDECIEGTHDCEQLCYNTNCTDGKYTCGCMNGYLLNADGLTCSDVNECLVNNGNCSHKCINTVGSYNCACNEGYALEPDLHSCRALPCPTLYAPENGRISCSGQQVTDETCQFSCNDGYGLEGSAVRLCQPDGTWNGTNATCPSLPCSPLVPTTSSYIDRTCSFLYNTSCLVMCADGYSLDATNLLYQRDCIVENKVDTYWSSEQTCNSIPPCSPTPCKNGYCYVQQDGEQTCGCFQHFTGEFCETRLLITPSFSQLILNEQSNSLNLQVATSHNGVTINIITDPSISVWPSNTIYIPPTASQESFKLTGTSIGTYNIKYEVYSQDAYYPPQDGHVIVYDDDSYTWYYNQTNSPDGILKPGCCITSSPSYQQYCPISAQNVSFSSSSCSMADDQSLHSNGVSFIHFDDDDISLPLSFIDSTIEFGSDSPIVSPTANGSSCHQCTNANIDKCTSNWQVTPNNAQTMVRYHSLLRTFLNSIDSLIPANITINQTANSQQSSHEVYDYMASFSKLSDVNKIAECDAFQSNDDALSYVIKTNAELEIVVNSNQLLFPSDQTTPLCFILDICNIPQSPLYVSLSKDGGVNILSLPVFVPYISAGWTIDIRYVRMSSYGINYASNVEFWSGTNVISHVSPLFTAGMSLGTAYSQTNGYIRVDATFNGFVDVSLETNELVRLNGESTLQITTVSHEALVMLQLTSNEAQGFLITHNDDVNTTRTKRDGHLAQLDEGFTIDVDYDPQMNVDFFGSLLDTFNSQPCLVSTFVRYDHGDFLPHWVSLYSKCLEVKILGARTSGLTTEITIPSSYSHWESSPNTTVRIKAYNDGEEPVKLGKYLSIPSYRSSNSYLLMDVNIDGSIRTIIYKANVSIYDVFVQADITITDKLYFDATTELFGEYQVSISGQISLPDGTWDNSIISIDSQFSEVSGTFFTNLQSYMYQSLRYMAEFTDTRLNLSQTNLDSASAHVQSLQSTIDSLQALNDTYVSMYEQSEETYEDALLNKETKSNLFNLFVQQYIDEATAENINNLCTEAACGEICQFTYDQTSCEATARLPIDAVGLNVTLSTETLRSMTSKVVEQCTSVQGCDYTVGVKWLSNTDGLLTLLPYNGIDCESVCNNIMKNQSTYTDSYLLLNVTSNYSYTQEWYNGERPYTCTVRDDCTYKLEQQPCVTSNVECDHLKKFQTINAISSSISAAALQELTSDYQDYKTASNDVVVAKANMNLNTLRIELNQQHLSIVRQAHESAQDVFEVVQNADGLLQSGLEYEIALADNLRSYLQPGNLLSIRNLNFSISTETSGIVQLNILYAIPFMSQIHYITREVDLKEPPHLLMRYVSMEIMNDFGKNAFSRDLPATPDNAQLFENNCILQNQLHNYLIYLNKTLEEANLQTTLTMSNITGISNALQAFTNGIISASSNISNEYTDVLSQNQMTYASEGQVWYSRLSSTIYNNSKVNWLKPIEKFFQVIPSTNLFNCSSFIDCLHYGLQHIYLSLINNGDASSTSLHSLLPTINSAISSIASTNQMSLPDVQANILKLYDVLQTIRQSNYWCSSKPNITTQPAPEVALTHNSTKSIQCSGESSLPITYKWLKDNVFIPFTTGKSLLIDRQSGTGTYQCLVSNDHSIVSSLSSTVLFYETPNITYHTTWAGTYYGDESGIRLTCRGISSPYMPSWKWYFSSDNGNTFTLLNETSLSSLFIENPQFTDIGWYKCEATTEYGVATSNSIPVYVWSPTIPVHRYRFQLTIFDTTADSLADSGSGSGDSQYTPTKAIDEIRNIIANNLSSHLNTSALHDIQLWQLQSSLPYFKLSFYVQSSNLTDSYYYHNQSIDKLAALTEDNIWELDKIVQNLRWYLSERDQQISFSGTFDITNDSLVVSSRIFACPIGSELHSNYLICVPCSPGHYVDGNNDVHRSLIPGQYIAESIPKCLPCPIGQYQSNGGSTSCVSCPITYSTDTTGSISRSQCKELCRPDSYSVNGLTPCSPCEASHYQPHYGASNCISCSAVYTDHPQCLEELTTGPSLDTTNIIIIASIIGGLLFFFLLAMLFVFCLLGMILQKRKKNSKIKKKIKKDLKNMYISKGTRNTASSEAYGSKSKASGDKKEYKDNPLHVSEKEAMDIKLKSTTSLSKTEMTAISTIDELSDIEKSLHEGDDVPLIEAETSLTTEVPSGDANPEEMATIEEISEEQPASPQKVVTFADVVENEEINGDKTHEEGEAEGEQFEEEEEPFIDIPPPLESDEEDDDDDDENEVTLIDDEGTPLIPDGFSAQLYQDMPTDDTETLMFEFTAIEQVAQDSLISEQVDQPTVEPVDQPTIEPVDQPTDEPVDQPTIEPVDQPTDEPVDQPTDEPVDQPTDEPVDQPTDEPVDQPTDEPVDQPTDEPVDQPTYEPVDQPTDEPEDQSIDELIIKLIPPLILDHEPSLPIIEPPVEEDVAITSIDEFLEIEISQTITEVLGEAGQEEILQEKSEEKEDNNSDDDDNDGPSSYDIINTYNETHQMSVTDIEPTKEVLNDDFLSSSIVLTLITDTGEV